MKHLSDPPPWAVLTHKYCIWLGRPSRYKHSSLLQKLVKSLIVQAPGACIIKLFTSVINPVGQEASAYAIVSHFLLSLTNTLAFYVTKLIKAVLSFMIQAHGGSVTKKEAFNGDSTCQTFSPALCLRRTSRSSIQPPTA